ncbi:hypothetical protein A3B21_00560 [Candidatus Uhrbacteria bacterium RIFCSPLOWO2_01_FULL_47_24]|uniref:TrpR like protein, YerC/YecD n=1 Tax=Candidatus Uhrbacteria bacterium RIFCSPLOWO2_01_FULL_47_24 TaxID=1802401 RepID=A0A1F7UNJ9_9BACT|nr:MAG: hypothetical protein A2753_04730 [Candidatus Uhrbacteria bacterium RIFCSPHIGHO2_01_FULL_47_11]OGL67665.1 MAG: hypothetical protein A3D58_04450 [Candidatus Uhrbacteria bacterium RIFCSPHIGHO2_02_FULL_46_47]OGL74848.1 MAG: hypothetical protein A3F52_00215 [Candidatus Uhrbacteria bacterium RIFCSPHIGHO2_12_FULL_47_11]OGL79870.1 MAG: hypothetical protein A3B21_00560 [Candidatus Uhrbacteria bacterium RIFCSPLOWO2_01_FULL_47_24]OGL84090.1 MAG: hypothetical protein A3J03_03355 [Candidatus Uhrbact
MAKFTPRQKLEKEAQQRVLLELCQSMVMVKNLKESARVLGDLLSEPELRMVAKRLQIAKQLLKGKKYEQIRQELKVSQQTIARVNLWLQQAGEGLRMVMARGLAKEDMAVPLWQPPAHAGEMWGSWAHLKRRYPLYFWPQGILEEIARAANNRQRKRMLETLKILRGSGKGKREVFRYLEALFRVERTSPRKPQQLEKEMQLGKVKQKVP